MHQVLPQTTKRKQKNPKLYGFENDDSSGESTSSCPPNFGQPRRNRRAGDVESEQPSVIQIIVNTAAQVEPIPNAFPSPVIGEVSPTDPYLRPPNQSPPDQLIINEEDMITQILHILNLIQYYLGLAMITSKYIVNIYLTGE